MAATKWGASRPLVARLGIASLSPQPHTSWWAGPGWQRVLGPASGLPGGTLSASLSTQPDIVLQWASALLIMPSRFWFQVVFGKKLPAFATIPLHQLQHEKKYDIYFADGKVFALYR